MQVQREVNVQVDRADSRDDRSSVDTTSKRRVDPLVTDPDEGEQGDRKFRAL